MNSRVHWLTALLVASLACSDQIPTTPPPPPPAGACGDVPIANNRVIAQFSPPMSGTFPLTNFFDHDQPGVLSNGHQLTWCGEEVIGRIDGHAGYDWVMPVGTPLRAVAGGVVSRAGVAAPFYCTVLDRPVADQQFVEILHPVVAGEQFSSAYMHLSRVDVEVGQVVTRGELIGLSGNTGCSTLPHLHLEVWRWSNTYTGAPVVVDPYGWQGEGLDPWTQLPNGGISAWLWLPGEAPLLRPE